MRIESVNFNNLSLAFHCEEKYRSILKSGIDLTRSSQWMMKATQHGFRGKLALDGLKTPLGSVFYTPLKHTVASFDTNESVIYMRCMHLSPKAQNSGIGQALIAAVKADSNRFAGIIAKASNTCGCLPEVELKSYGFKNCGVHRGENYMFLPVKSSGVRIKAYPEKYTPDPLKVEITIFNDGFCPFWNNASSVIEPIVKAYSNSVTVRNVELTSNRARQYGIEPICLVDGESVPIEKFSEEFLRMKIQKAIAGKIPTELLVRNDTVSQKF